MKAYANTTDIIYSDDGHGLNADMQQHLFAPFVTSKRHDGRIGLGGQELYLLVTQKLGGEIEIIPNANTGLSIRIRLPNA